MCADANSEPARRTSSLRHEPGLTRRALLARAAGYGCLVAGLRDDLLAAQPSSDLPVVPRINGGINVHPVRRLGEQDGLPVLGEPDDLPVIIPELVDLQLRTVYELGIQQIRTTVTFDAFGFGRSFLGAIPYVRAARALGIDVLGLIEHHHIKLRRFEFFYVESQDGVTRDRECSFGVELTFGTMVEVYR